MTEREAVAKALEDLCEALPIGHRWNQAREYIRLAVYELIEEEKPEPEPIEVGQVWCQWGGVDGSGWWIGMVYAGSEESGWWALEHVADGTYTRSAPADELRKRWRRIPYRREEASDA